MAESTLASADLAEVAARFGGRLRLAGLAVGPDRCERFARAITVAQPASIAQLRWCARATLAAGPGQLAVLDRVFDEVFGGLSDPADERGDPNAPALPGTRTDSSSAATRAGAEGPPGVGSGDSDPRAAQVELPTLAAAAERLASQDFAELSAEELLLLADLMRRLTIATPKRRCRRLRPVAEGRRADLRATLRRAHRTGGDPAEVIRRRKREKPRRLVALCDISGSMAPYSRAMLQLLYCAAGGDRAEVFTFATRLTRLTGVLARSTPALALERAGKAAPDWRGGTRIAAALKDFVDGYGRAGLARGAVVLIISDGWETGDPADVGRQMARLSRLAYRIVWANPRTQSSRFQPLVGGMAAAWPYCDAVVSAHRIAALSDLVAALGDPVRQRRPL